MGFTCIGTHWVWDHVYESTCIGRTPYTSLCKIYVWQYDVEKLFFLYIIYIYFLQSDGHVLTFDIETPGVFAK
jgi:hypothetical protein